MSDSKAIRFACKLLFAYVFLNRGPNQVATIERRIILLDQPVRNTSEATKLACRYGKQEEYRFANANGELIEFTFLGIVDVIELGIETESCEVWYDICRRKLSSLIKELRGPDKA